MFNHNTSPSLSPSLLQYYIVKLRVYEQDSAYLNILLFDVNHSVLIFCNAVLLTFNFGTRSYYALHVCPSKICGPNLFHSSTYNVVRRNCCLRNSLRCRQRSILLCRKRIQARGRPSSSSRRSWREWKRRWLCWQGHLQCPGRNSWYSIGLTKTLQYHS